MDYVTVCVSGGKTFRQDIAGEGMSIGRSSSNDLVLEDPGVSRSHARIARFPEGFFLLDGQALVGRHAAQAFGGAARPLHLDRRDGGVAAETERQRQLAEADRNPRTDRPRSATPPASRDGLRETDRCHTKQVHPHEHE